MRYYNNHINDPCVDGGRPSSGECPFYAIDGVPGYANGRGIEWFKGTRASEERLLCPPGTAYVRIRPHTSAYVSMQHCQHTTTRSASSVLQVQHTSAYVSIRQHASAYVSEERLLCPPGTSIHVAVTPTTYVYVSSV
jgi:hypothetical protein